MIGNNDKNMIIPEGFPVEGNVETLKLMQQVFEKCVNTEKIFTCAMINTCTVNIDFNQHNSNFLVMPAGTCKTYFLEVLQKSNNDTVLKIGNHKEADIFAKDSDDFIQKTWVSFDCAPSFTSSRKQLNQLMDFYCGTLSDGVFGAYDKEIYTNYNLIYAITKDQIDKLYTEFKTRGLIERIVPIFFIPTEEDMEKIREHFKGTRLSEEIATITLPNIKEINNGKQLGYQFNEELKDKIFDLKSELEVFLKNSSSRRINYVMNFLAANALINNRITGENGEKFVIPDIHDIEMFQWLMNVHDGQGYDRAYEDAHKVIYVDPKYNV